MQKALSPTGTVLGGTAIVMACACGVASNSSKLLAAGGVTLGTRLLHPILIGIGAALILAGLWRIRRSAAVLAGLAFATLPIASAHTPPMAMSRNVLPWGPEMMLGAAMYIPFAMLLGYALWMAFPTSRPRAAGVAVGGMALSTGCNCCMVTGALSGLIVSGGASMEFFNGNPVVFWSGIAVVTAGLFKLGGYRAAAFAPLGAAVVQFGPRLLRLTGDWNWAADVNFRFIPGYLVYLLGFGIILYGFVRAFRAARPAQLPAAPTYERERVLVGAD